MVIFMVQYMTMKKVNIADVKTHLSALLDAVSGGERIVICKRNRPVAELIPTGAARTGPRPIGGARDRFFVPPAFFEPLPDEVADAFDASAFATPAPGTSRVAERGTSVEPTRKRTGRARR